MRKLLTILLSSILLMLSGCVSGTSKSDNSSMQCYGDIDNQKSLRICIDIQDFWTSDLGHLDRSMEDFIALLKAQTGLENVIVEYLPSPNTNPNHAYNGSTGEEAVYRKTTIDRLKAEILSGGGPDVFIVTQMNANPYAALLFSFPEKTMESGLFLPLDEYMKDAKFAEWEKFPQAIMDAGRNNEGQQIIPLVYTLPVVTYSKLVFDYTPDRLLSWNDMLNDSILAPYASVLADCSEQFADDITHETERAFNNQFEFVLGELADYEREELLFTEEELLQRVNEVLAIETEESEKSSDAMDVTIGAEMCSTLDSGSATMIPMYSDDGGITASIQSFAAVNRNTEKPEEAFLVIDYLLDAKVQSSSGLYSNFLCKYDGIPVHQDILQEGMPLCGIYTLTNENYKEFCEVRDQITTAHFENGMGMVLAELLASCSVADQQSKSVEELVHEAYINLQRRVRE